MAKRQVFIRNREFLDEVSQITGVNIIDIEYEFGKAELWNRTCIVEIDITSEQAAELDRHARSKRSRR